MAPQDSQSSEVPRSWPAFLLATALGAGCLRPAPGTWGSIAGALAALPVVLWLPPSWWLPAFALGTVLWTVLGLWSCPWAIRYYRRGDPSQVVMDEVAGLWLTLALLAAVPGLMQSLPYVTILSGLVAFRVFDVAKPWPVSRLESLPGGWGIMLDDLGAGVLAAVAAAVGFYVCQWAGWYEFSGVATAALGQ